MEKIRNFSLKKAIVFYVTMSFIVTFFLSVFTVNIAAEIQNNIWWIRYFALEYCGKHCGSRNIL